MAAELELMVDALLNRRALELRELIQDYVRLRPDLTTVPAPAHSVPLRAAAIASLVEFIADKMDVPAPSWTSQIPGLENPMYLVASAEKLASMRGLCDDDSPPAFRRRNFLAPPNFLTFA